MAVETVPAMWVFGQDGNSTIGNGTSDSNGLSEVIINHSPLADVITKDGNQISVFDETSLAGLCWYISSKNTNAPEFSSIRSRLRCQHQGGKDRRYVCSLVTR